MRLSLLFFLVLAVSATADFNRTSEVIDVPTGHTLGLGQLRAGAVGGLALSLSEDTHDADIDFAGAIGLGKGFEISTSIFSLDNVVVLGMSKQILARKNTWLAVGVHDLSYSWSVSSVGGGADQEGWDDDVQYEYGESIKPAEAFSLFLTGTKSFNTGGDLTLGLGRGRFVGYGPNSKYFNTEFYTDDKSDWAIGLFIGYKLPITRSLDLLFDLDGRDANLGLCLHTKRFEVAVAGVKLEQLWADGLSSWVSAGLFYKTGLVPEKPKDGIIAGTVTDRETGKPVAAVVAIENSGIPGSGTDPLTGYYTFEGLPPATYNLVGTAQGYESSTRMVVVKAGQLTRVDFSLVRAKPIAGQLTGSVLDRKTSAPLIAELSLFAVATGVVAGQPVGQTKSAQTGAYAFADVPAGNYQLRAEAMDYADQVINLTISAGARTTQDIHMLKVGMVITLQGIKFDFNKATIKPESAPVLDEAAAMLENNPDIKVEIQGHTDNVGSRTYNLRLSQARAQAVVDYLVAKQGISTARLSARGYGFSMPVASNATVDGRAQNRRVEFVIVK